MGKELREAFNVQKGRQGHTPHLTLPHFLQGPLCATNMGKAGMYHYRAYSNYMLLFTLYSIPM